MSDTNVTSLPGARPAEPAETDPGSLLEVADAMRAAAPAQDPPMADALTSSATRLAMLDTVQGKRAIRLVHTDHADPVDEDAATVRACTHVLDGVARALQIDGVPADEHARLVHCHRLAAVKAQQRSLCAVRDEA